jgi:glycosyltransferase involved in cell wall biosynthesis
MCEGFRGAMKLCYYTIGGFSLTSGIYQKMFATVECWREFGHDTVLSIGARAETAAHADFQNRVVSSKDLLFWTWKSAIIRPIAEMRTALRIAKWAPDVVYLRNGHFSPGIIPLLRAAPIVVELNTNDDVERRSFGPLHYAYFQLSCRYVYPNAAGFVAVTREIANLERFAKSGKEVRVIANGIDFRRSKTLPVSSEVFPALVMLACGQFSWHGIDKLAVLARRFPKWRIEVIGDFDVPDSFDSINNIILHGFLRKAEYEIVLQRAHVGIGSLALHRKQINEACPLKSREYLACGLPVIAGYEDTDFPGGADFLLQIGNYEENVAESLDKIEAFVLRWMHRRVERSQVHIIDLVEKEKTRLRFMRELSGFPSHPEKATFVC